MSPRPRTVQDDVILGGAAQVLGQIGLERFTLADVGAAVGLSAATLVQRFGSKRDLMLSILRHEIEEADNRFTVASSQHTSPLDALFAAAEDRAGPLANEQTLGNRIAFYLSALDDPDFRELALENSQRAVDNFSALLQQAIEAGELSATYVETEQLAEAVYAMIMGSMLMWSVTNEGSVTSKVRRDLDILLRPFRRRPRKAASPRTTDIARQMAAAVVEI